MKKFITAAVILSLLTLSACGNETQEYSSISNYSIPEGSLPEDIAVSETADMDFTFSDRDLENGYDENLVSTPTDNGDSYSITTEGVYVFSGEITDKTIIISAGENDKIQIVLDNAIINNSQNAAIYVESADKVFLTLAEGSENSVTAMGNEEIDGAVFSRADLTINGNGKLTLNGNYKHAIVSKDDLVVANANLDITAENVGLNGKDCVKISNANINIKAGSDGIRSDNDEDASRGYVYIESGNIDITSGNDGIQAETVINIITAEMNILSGSGSSAMLNNSDESYKGLKAVSDITIQDGNYTIDSTDDCIHSNNSIVIKNGNFALSSGDDGIHADSDLAISSGNMVVSKSYEGLEASRIFVTGGNIDITASDDGLNAAGGNDQSSMGGRPGMGGFDNGIGEIVISGGYMLVDSYGDGIDSNGTFSLTGGVVLVSGPTNNGNGAFDYGSGAAVNGGVLIALGSSGMATGFTQAENQGAVLYNFTAQNAGTSFAICDENGTAIASFTPEKGYNSAVVTAPEMVEGGTYKLVAGGTVENADVNGFARNTAINGGSVVAEITLDSLIYNVGGGFGGGFGGGHGGGHGGFGGETPPDGFGGETPPDGFGGGTPPDGFGGGMPPDGYGGGYRP